MPRGDGKVLQKGLMRRFHCHFLGFIYKDLVITSIPLIFIIGDNEERYEVYIISLFHDDDVGCFLGGKGVFFL